MVRVMAESTAPKARRLAARLCRVATRRSNQLRDFSRLVALPHTVFSLPFALGAAVIAGTRAAPPLTHYLWIVVAVAAARTAAMAFNRYVDRDIDAKNPRTQDRELPRGQVTATSALVLTVAAAGVFELAAWRLGRLPLALSLIALVVCLGYSFSKRFTAFPHLVLGLALAGAPAGAWVAITGSFSLAALALSVAVLAWVAGFDIIYSCQDVAFDRRQRLGSVPARWGVAVALRLSAVLHVVTVVGLVLFGSLLSLGLIYFVGVGAIVATLVYEHRIVSPTDLSRVNRAFFTLNGYVSLLFFACTLVEALS